MARYNSLSLASKVGKLASNAGKLQISQTRVVGKVVQLNSSSFQCSKRWFSLLLLHVPPSTHIQCWDHNRTITCKTLKSYSTLGQEWGKKEKKGVKSSCLPNTVRLTVPLCYFTHIIYAPTRTKSIRKYKDLNV